MISKEYKKILSSIHENTSFGKRSKIPPYLDNFIKEVSPSSILDFGCGKGRLVERLKEEYPNIEIIGYDPCNEKFDKSIDNLHVDLLISTDVLEHIEPVFLDETLQFLSSKSKYIYHLISCAPAKLVLPDGRNAHLIQESKEWWKTKFINLGYNILKEDYSEFYKTSKVVNKPILVKNYFLMAKNGNFNT